MSGSISTAALAQNYSGAPKFSSNPAHWWALFAR